MQRIDNVLAKPDPDIEVGSGDPDPEATRRELRAHAFEGRRLLQQTADRWRGFVWASTGATPG